MYPDLDKRKADGINFADYRKEMNPVAANVFR